MEATVSERGKNGDGPDRCALYTGIEDIITPNPVNRDGTCWV